MLLYLAAKYFTIELLASKAPARIYASLYILNILRIRFHNSQTCVLSYLYNLTVLAIVSRLGRGLQAGATRRPAGKTDGGVQSLGNCSHATPLPLTPLLGMQSAGVRLNLAILSLSICTVCPAWCPGIKPQSSEPELLSPSKVFSTRICSLLPTYFINIKF